VAAPYLLIFLGLLVAYMVYSVWAELDARLPVAAGVGLLLLTALSSPGNDPGVTDTLAIFAFALLGAGVVLLFVDRLRLAWGLDLGPVRTEPTAPGGQGPDGGEPTAQ